MDLLRRRSASLYNLWESMRGTLTADQTTLRKNLRSTVRQCRTICQMSPPTSIFSS